VCGGSNQFRGEKKRTKKTIKKKKKEKNIRNELHIYIPENIDTKVNAWKEKEICSEKEDQEK